MFLEDRAASLSRSWGRGGGEEEGAVRRWGGKGNGKGRRVT